MLQNPFTDAINALADTFSQTNVLASAAWLRHCGHTCLAERAVATFDPGRRPLRAPRHRGHDVVAAIAVEGTSALRLGTYPLDAGDG